MGVSCGLVPGGGRLGAEGVADGEGTAVTFVPPFLNLINGTCGFTCCHALALMAAI